MQAAGVTATISRDTTLRNLDRNDRKFEAAPASAAITSQIQVLGEMLKHMLH